MNPSPLFSFMFFFMLILLAISSICGGWEAFIGSVMDEFPQLRTRRVTVMVVSCVAAFLFGFPICFESGFLLFQLMDSRTASAVLIMAFVEVLLCGWIYGAGRFMNHIKEMDMNLPTFMKWYWRGCWQIVTPIIVAFITITYWVDHEADGFLDYSYPDGAQGLGWFIELFPLSIVVCFAFIMIIRACKNGKGLKYLVTPKPSWGPRADSGLIKPSQGMDNPSYVSP